MEITFSAKKRKNGNSWFILIPAGIAKAMDNSSYLITIQKEVDTHGASTNI